jgi:hypothetical protein
MLSGGACVMIPIPAPRAIAPLSTATVTSQRPTLHWVLAGADDGAHVTLCRDRTLTIGCVSFDAVGSSGRPAAALASGVWFWQLAGRNGALTGSATSPVWEFFVGARSVTVDTSSGTVLDVNGDGYADVAVGAPSQPGGAGAVSVYFGAAGSLATTAGWTQTGIAGADLGWAVASAGDVNGDGYDDLAVSAYDSTTYVGTTMVYLGGASGPATTAAWMHSLYDSAVASAGDVNGDGYADLIVGDPLGGIGGQAMVFLGSASGLAATPAWTQNGASMNSFGASVASAGDINADGFADVVVGVPNYFTSNGAAYVYLGGAAGLATTAAWMQIGPASSFYGQVVAGAGDVNGDGYSDVVIGVPWGGGPTQPGAANVYLGSAAGLGVAIAWTQSGTATAAYFGGSVASAGDVNGDGYGDLVVGAQGAFLGSPGSAYTYLGSSTGLASIAVWSHNAPGATRYGIAVAGAGDVDGDGFGDIVVGEARALTSATAYVYRGAAGGPGVGPAWMQSGPTTSLFGASVASVGNVRGALPPI